VNFHRKRKKEKITIDTGVFPLFWINFLSSRLKFFVS